MRSSLNSREDTSCIAASSWLKPKSSPVLVHSEELAAKGGNPQPVAFLRHASSIDGDIQEVKLTMLVESVVVDDGRKSELY